LLLPLFLLFDDSCAAERQAARRATEKKSATLLFNYMSRAAIKTWEMVNVKRVL
jgi:hypothetical protein